MMTAVSYPPSPWHLKAAGHLSIWRVPVRNISNLDLPAGVTPVAFARSAWLAAGLVAYRPGGVLTYNELFLATLVRVNHQLGLTIIAIWVDSDASLRGGRELWGVPKQRAEFRRANAQAPSIEVVGSEGVLARTRFDAHWRWPTRASAKSLVVQDNAGALQCTPAIASARMNFGKAEWEFAERSPFEILRERKPLFSIGLIDADIRFGA